MRCVVTLFVLTLAFVLTSVAPVRAQTTEHYVLFPAGHQPADPKNERTFSGDATKTYVVKGDIAGSFRTEPIADSLMDATFDSSNTKVVFTPRASVTPAEFAAVSTARALGMDATFEAGRGSARGVRRLDSEPGQP